MPSCAWDLAPPAESKASRRTSELRVTRSFFHLCTAFPQALSLWRVAMDRMMTIESGGSTAPARKGNHGQGRLSAVSGSRVEVACECGIEERAERVMARARIPKRYEHCDFESFATDLADGRTWTTQHEQSLKQGKLLAQGFVRDYPAT